MATITERFGFTKPAGSDPASIVPLNSNTDLIEQYLGRTQDMIAPMYDDTETYSVGDLRTYESRLYKCNTDISTPETFDPEKWDLTTAVQEGGGSGGASAIEKTQAEYDALTPAQKTNGAIYMVQGSQELDDNYSYYSAENDTIIVRVYHEGESDQKIEWFFRGWNQTSGDMTVPSNLTAYLPSTPQIAIYSANYPNDTTPQNGWIGFYGGSIRAWTQDLANTMTGIMYGVVDIDGGADQTNPHIDDPHIYVEGSNKIYYMGIEYANTNGGSGGGGNASLEATVLYDTPITANGTYTLADSYENYDFISIKAGNGSSETDVHTYAVDDIKRAMNDSKVITNPNTGGWFNFTMSTNTITIPNKSISTIYSVIGYKIVGGGGEGGSSDAGDINYDNTTSQLTADNVQEAIDEVVANAGTASEDILTLQNVQGYDEYDETQTYAVGDYAIYNNIVYECTTAVSTAEPFDSTKWTATSIEQIIDGVKGDVSQLNSSLVNREKHIGGLVYAYWNAILVTIDFGGAIPIEAANNANTIIATLPSDVPKPSTTKYGVISCGGNSNKFVLGAIQTNGNILVYNYSGASTSYLYGSIKFLR